NDSLYDAGMEISRARGEIAAMLETSIGKELDSLEMKKARFAAVIYTEGKDVGKDGTRTAGGDTAKVRFKPDGLDKVEFLISPNLGEPLKPLSKIASGGEMARILLAIKSILAGVDKVPVLIFDEIDIGISGRVAQRVGEKLALLSKKHQVICVTHHPQIASMADNHYMVEKYVEGNITKIKVERLSGEKITDEIARILGSHTITEATRKLADEMLDNAKKFKGLPVH
ncbi:MAG: DNA repair protein RecN, partial [Clostridiaceae bacterium]|nr:DNA repair protein RecN [Clostridiaceae bacterium]